MKIPHGDPLRFWARAEQGLLFYEMALSPARWRPWRGLFWGREGAFVLLRGTALAGALAVVSTTDWDTIAGRVLGSVAITLALLMLIDILLVHASITFVSRRSSNHLRTLVLSVLSFFQIPLVFAVFYTAAVTSFCTPLTWIRAVYFSVVTATTAGFGDIVPRSDAALVQGLVVAELVASVTFLGVVVASLVGMVGGGQQGRGGLKAQAPDDVEHANGADAA